MDIGFVNNDVNSTAFLENAFDLSYVQAIRKYCRCKATVAIFCDEGTNYINTMFKNRYWTIIITSR